MTMLDADLEMEPDAPPTFPETTVPTTFDLPAGYLDSDGRRHTTATVQELTGGDEEAIAKAGKSKNPIDYVDALLLAGTTSVGPYDATPSLLENLLVGDRDTLLLAIRRETYGDELRFEDVTCTKCGVIFSVTVDLASEVPIKQTDTPGPFSVPLRSGTALVRPAAGVDQRKVYGLGAEATVPQMNTALLASCLLELNGVELLAMPEEPEDVARSLGLRDREILLKALMGSQPGPDYEEVKMSCPSCDKEYPLTLGVVDLFRP